MITPLPGVTETKPGSATQAAAGHRGRGGRRGRRRRRHDEQGLLVAAPAVAGRCCARSTRRTTASSRPTARSSATRRYFVGDAARKRRGRLLLGHRARRRRDQRLRPPAVDRRGRVGDRLAPEGRRGRGDRPARRGHRPGDRRVRDARGRRSRATTSSSSEIREHVAKRIGKLARPKRIIWADDLPKTRSGKIMRRLLRDIAEGRELGDVTTLRDPDVMAAARGQDQGAPGRGRGVAARASGRSSSSPQRRGGLLPMAKVRGPVRHACAPTALRKKTREHDSPSAFSRSARRQPAPGTAPGRKADLLQTCKGGRRRSSRTAPRAGPAQAPSARARRRPRRTAQAQGHASAATRRRRPRATRARSSVDAVRAVGVR